MLQKIEGSKSEQILEIFPAQISKINFLAS